MNCNYELRVTNYELKRVIHLKNIVYEKSFSFAIEVLKIAKRLRSQGEYEVASQILRSGTSIGANIAEAKYAQSSKDFISKMSIARKEANETLYWLHLLIRADVLPKDIVQPLADDVLGIIKILTSIIKTTMDRNDTATDKNDDKIF